MFVVFVLSMFRVLILFFFFGGAKFSFVLNYAVCHILYNVNIEHIKRQYIHTTTTHRPTAKKIKKKRKENKPKMVNYKLLF